MELTSDLVAVQGILISTIKTTGEFTRINNKGGNEHKILNVMMEIQKFLSIKNYIKNDQINNEYDKQLDDIVFFLAINTTYKEPLNLDECDHLINIMPQLSKCLLVNIVYGLDLCKYYCTVIEKLPISYSIELLEETVPCLKKSILKVQLRNAFMFLKAAVNKLASTNYSKQEEDNIDKLSRLTDVILQNLSGLSLDQARDKKSIQIYQHMGYCLLHLFELLLYCSKDNINLKQFIKNVLKTCCSVVRSITINVFCSWAEINQDDQPLQNLVSEKAYLVIEKYKKYDEAKELLSMLVTMAKKPKTLTERIQEADISTIIKNIDKDDQDQKRWFQALLNTQIFKNKESVDCVNKWAHLCDETDVTRLLNLCCQSRSTEANKLAIKCASNLSLEDIILVSTQYYYTNKFKYVLNEDVESQLMLIFNKISGEAHSDDHFVKEISLVLLQNPVAVLNYIYRECLKNSCYTKYLTNTFSTISEIAEIDSIGVNTFKDVILKIKPCFENVENYTELFKRLLEANYFSRNVILTLLHLSLEHYYTEKCFKELNYTLQIFLGCSIKMPLKEESRSIIELILNIMNDCRCNFDEFSSTKQLIVKYIINIITDLWEINANYNFKVDANIETDDDFTIYYKKYLSCETDLSLFGYMCREFNVDDYVKCASQLVQILSCAVTPEWLNVTEEVYSKCGINTFELLSDVMIILCEVAQSPADNPDNKLSALKYCIQHFGMVMQQFQTASSLEMEMNVTRHVCRVLRYIPEEIKEEEGLPLISILTDRSLKSLANDKEFVCRLISVNNPTICKILAKKVTS